jgi:fatty acid desaturase
MTDTGVAAETGDTDTAESADEPAYRGVIGAFPYAFRQSESRLFRSYVVIGGLATVVLSLTFVLALIYLIGGSFGAQAGAFTFSRTFYVVVALAVVAPVMAPVLFVARRHRRSDPDRSYDRALAASGYVFLLSLYVMLVISAPADLRDPAEGAFAPAIEFLYGLPPLAGLVPPAMAATLVYLVHRWRR